MTITISISKLRDKLTSVFEDVKLNGAIYLVTKRGKICAQINPLREIDPSFENDPEEFRKENNPLLRKLAKI